MKEDHAPRQREDAAARQQGSPPDAVHPSRLTSSVTASAPTSAGNVQERPRLWAPVDLEGLRAAQQHFAEQRDWQQFHTPRNLLLALTGEVGELAECFQWKGEVRAGLPEMTAREREHVGQELSDCLLYLVRLADVCGVDLGAAALAKIQANAAKYPADQCKGKADKYTAYTTTQAAVAGAAALPKPAGSGGGGASTPAAEPQQAPQRQNNWVLVGNRFVGTEALLAPMLPAAVAAAALPPAPLPVRQAAAPCSWSPAQLACPASQEDVGVGGVPRGVFTRPSYETQQTPLVADTPAPPPAHAQQHMGSSSQQQQQLYAAVRGGGSEAAAVAARAATLPLRTASCLTRGGSGGGSVATSSPFRTLLAGGSGGGMASSSPFGALYAGGGDGLAPASRAPGAAPQGGAALREEPDNLLDAGIAGASGMLRLRTATDPLPPQLLLQAQQREAASPNASQVTPGAAQDPWEDGHKRKRFTEDQKELLLAVAEAAGWSFAAISHEQRNHLQEVHSINRDRLQNFIANHKPKELKGRRSMGALTSSQTSSHAAGTKQPAGCSLSVAPGSIASVGHVLQQVQLQQQQAGHAHPPPLPASVGLQPAASPASHTALTSAGPLAAAAHGGGCGSAAATPLAAPQVMVNMPGSSAIPAQTLQMLLQAASGGARGMLGVEVPSEALVGVAGSSGAPDGMQQAVAEVASLLDPGAGAVAAATGQMCLPSSTMLLHLPVGGGGAQAVITQDMLLAAQQQQRRQQVMALGGSGVVQSASGALAAAPQPAGSENGAIQLALPQPLQQQQPMIMYLMQQQQYATMPAPSQPPQQQQPPPQSEHGQQLEAMAVAADGPAPPEAASASTRVSGGAGNAAMSRPAGGAVGGMLCQLLAPMAPGTAPQPTGGL